MRCVVVDDDPVHGEEIVRRWGMENPPPGWSCERVAEGDIGDTVAALMASPDPPRLILYATDSAHLPAWREAWAYARARGCLAVVALGSNVPGAAAGPARLPRAYVTAGGDAATPGEETGIGPGMWFEGRGYDGVPWQSYVVPVVAGALARARETVADLTPGEGEDVWTLAIRALMAGADAPRSAGEVFAEHLPERGFGLVTKDTAPVRAAAYAPLAPFVDAAPVEGAPGAFDVSLQAFGGQGVGAAVLGTFYAGPGPHRVYLPGGVIEAAGVAVRSDGSAAPAHSGSVLALDVEQGYVPPAPALSVRRDGGHLLVEASAVGAASFVVAVTDGENEVTIEATGGDAAVPWPAHLPARVSVQAGAADGFGDAAVRRVPPVQATGTLASTGLHPAVVV